MRKVIIISVSVSLFLLTVKSVEGSIIATDKQYTYEDMMDDMTQLQAMEDVYTCSIGKTALGRDLVALKIGHGQKNILLIGAHHGREWMTSLLLMKMAENYIVNKHQYKLDGVAMWFVPMLNPDGVSIQQHNFSNMSLYQQYRIWGMNGYSFFFKRWKSNSRGVDLNRQYPAGWISMKAGNAKPSYQFYKGASPISERETEAIVSFTKRIHPSIAVSYHSSGEQIFWQYKTKFENIERDWKIANKIAKATGYVLDDPKREAEGAGFTDWFITEFSLPALTIEIGQLIENTEVPLSEFQTEWVRNRDVGMLLVDEAKKLK